MPVIKHLVSTLGWQGQAQSEVADSSPSTMTCSISLLSRVIGERLGANRDRHEIERNKQQKVAEEREDLHCIDVVQTTPRQYN